MGGGTEGGGGVTEEEILSRGERERGGMYLIPKEKLAMCIAMAIEVYFDGRCCD